MSHKCKAFSASKLGLEPDNNRKAFYAGWDAATQRQWVNLTDDEIALVCAECGALANSHFSPWDDISYARAIEAKLREKNA